MLFLISLGIPYQWIPRILKDGTPAGPGENIWSPVRKADAGSGDTDIAAAGVPINTGGSSSGDPNNIQWPRHKYPDKKAPPGPGARLRLAHHELGGEMIMEKQLKNPQECFKDMDFKPEFPENPPPPQIKGLHPDLVTGEKVSQRYNSLDPNSAKAMPRTGIKAVDLKVAAAAKKDVKKNGLNASLDANWRNDVEVLKELNWSPTSGNGPTNSTSGNVFILPTKF